MCTPTIVQDMVMPPVFANYCHLWVTHASMLQSHGIFAITVQLKLCKLYEQNPPICDQSWFDQNGHKGAFLLSFLVGQSIISVPSNILCTSAKNGYVYQCSSCLNMKTSLCIRLFLSLNPSYVACSRFVIGLKTFQSRINSFSTMTALSEEQVFSLPISN